MKSGKKTLLISVLMSFPGPIVVGLGLLVGQGSTQIADFVRRSIELIAIIIAYVVYLITTKDVNTDIIKKQHLERVTNIFVSITMILSGIIMILIAALFPSNDKSNVIPGLVIAILGVTVNSIFWIKYKVLGNKTNNEILNTQSKLYRAKTFVDASVVIALTVVLLSVNTKVSFYVDLIGTIIVSLYLIYTVVTSLIKYARLQELN